jgi:hypothetical protein
MKIWKYPALNGRAEKCFFPNGVDYFLGGKFEWNCVPEPG